MVHAADFGRLGDQYAWSPASQMLAREAGASDVTLRHGWAVLCLMDGVERHPWEMLRVSASAIRVQTNKNFHACVAAAVSLGHGATGGEACGAVVCDEGDALYLEWVVADCSTNVINAGEVRVTGRIRQSRGST